MRKGEKFSLLHKGQNLFSALSSRRPQARSGSNEGRGRGSCRPSWRINCDHCRGKVRRPAGKILEKKATKKTSLNGGKGKTRPLTRHTIPATQKEHKSAFRSTPGKSKGRDTTFQYLRSKGEEGNTKAHKVCLSVRRRRQGNPSIPLRFPRHLTNRRVKILLKERGFQKG